MIKNLLYNLYSLPDCDTHSAYAQESIDVVPMDIDTWSPSSHKQTASFTNSHIMHLQSVTNTAQLPQLTFSSLCPSRVTKIDPFDLSDLTKALPRYYPPAPSVEEQLAQQFTKLRL
ncbi:2375_t:CDS:1 [Paraglomus brasilianum]|uniref:2375_t:CDS:1 n=1 Tax=Paraglomus brasilianum TaxID=144538 RepID=A0A9N9FVC9_9GLOM|nr:2375_t:CDS:1 [Paraglomus brasilianum]